MKLTIIHGQNHKGSSYNIGRLVANSLCNESDITEFFLPKDLNHFCLGCYKCVEDESSCPFYTEKLPLYNAIKNSELIIFTTPVYCMGASAPMKSFLDLSFTNWMTHKPKDYMFQKRVLIIATSAGSSGKNAIKDIKTSLSYWGISKIDSYTIAVQATGWNTIKKERMEKIQRDVNKIIVSQKKLVNNTKAKVGLKTKIMFAIFSGMQKANWGASPTEKEYWNKKGWLGKARPWKSSK